jgi:hypothetical protein
MKKLFLGVLIVLIFAFTLNFSENYITSFSAAVKSWEESDLSQAISLVTLSLSSTFDVAYAPDLWYFKARLELMVGNVKEAKKSLEMAASVFHPKAVYSLLNSLANASLTSFSPVANVSYVNSIKGFYDGELFYSPISVATRYNSYYVLDGANHFVEEFGMAQKRHTLSVNSTPTSLIYSQKLDSFFISFENGYIYEYSHDFSRKIIFAKGLAHPIVSFADNMGRIYVVNTGKDAVDVFECDGSIFKTFNFFKERVHILGNIREMAGVMYVMDYTTKSVQRFNVINGQKLSSIPFPKGPLPTSFEVLNSNVLFVNSSELDVGGIKFPLENSKSVFSSLLTERILMTCDVESNKVNLYEVKTNSIIFVPVIDNLTFSSGKVSVKFRILDPLGSTVENPGKVVVNDNGFTKATTLSKMKISSVVHYISDVRDIFKMKKDERDLVVVKASVLNGNEHKVFASSILNNITFYVIEDIPPTKLEETLVKATGGDFISQSEANSFDKFASKMISFEFEASYPSILPNGVDEVDLMYGTENKYVDSVYYTFQNVMK